MIKGKDDSTMVSNLPAEEKPAAKKPTTTKNAKTVARKPAAKKSATKKPGTNTKTSAKKPVAAKSAPIGLPENAEPTDKTTSGTEKVQTVESVKGNNDSAAVKVKAEAEKSLAETNGEPVSTQSDLKKVVPETSPQKAKKVDKTASKTEKGKTKTSKNKDKSKNKAKKSKAGTSKTSDLKLHQRAYSTIIGDPQSITEAELLRINTRAGLTALLRQKKINLGKINRVLDYEEDLKALQVELLKLQRTVQEKNQRVVIIFEGRDAAGKGGAIRRFMEHLNPRAVRVVALPIPTAEERGQWYFQRYLKQMPNRGEMVFFDRSWYNRAVVEPVNGFCTKGEYKRFMLQVPEFEHMLSEDGIHLIKFYFSISKREQIKRFKARRENPLKQWKLSPLDAKAQQLWEEYTHYKEMMFTQTHTTSCPWIIVHANNKMKARLESIRYVISTLEYEGKDSSNIRLYPNVDIVQRYQRDSII